MKNSVNQGDIWLFDPDPTKRTEIGKKIRPCIIISTNLLNQGPSGLVIIVPLTSKLKGIPSHIEMLPPEGGLKDPSYAVCEQVRAISTQRLIKQLGNVESREILKEIHQWLSYLILLK